MIKRSIKNTISIILILLGFTCNIAASSLLSHKINGVDKFGNFNTFIQIQTVLGYLLSLGLDLTVDKYFPVYLTRGKFYAIKVYNKLYFSILNNLFNLFVIIITLVYVYHMMIGFTFIEDSKLFIENIYLLLTAFVIAVTIYFAKIIRISGSLISSISLYIALPQVLFVLFIYFSNVHNPDEAAKLFSLSWLIPLVIAIIILAKFSTLDIGLIDIKYTLAIKIRTVKHVIKKSILRDGVLMMASSTSDNILGISIVIMNIILYNAKDVGLASAVAGLCLIYSLIVKTISALFRPKLKITYLANVSVALEMIKKYTILSVILATALTLIYIIFGEEILVMVYGNEYKNAYVILIIVSIGYSLVEGFNIHKIVLEIFDSKQISKIVIKTNIFSIILVSIGCFFGINYAVGSFLLVRIVYVCYLLRSFNHTMKGLCSFS